MGRTTTHVHVWKSLLEQAGFTLEDIPREWNAFWSFWCDDVQPALRKALSRDDIWAVGLSMGVGVDAPDAFFQFLAAIRGGVRHPRWPLVIDDPEIRLKLIEALDSYTAFYRKGCTPADAVNWSTGDRNNKAFLAQTVVMTENESLSIPNALKNERPDDYYERTATIEWPVGPTASLFDRGLCHPCHGVQGWRPRRDGRGVRALPRGRGLADALPQLLRRAHAAADAEAARPALLARPERPASHGRGDAGQSRPCTIPHQALGDPRHDRVWEEWTWAKAVHRVAADGSAPSRRSTRRSRGSSRS